MFSITGSRRLSALSRVGLVMLSRPTNTHSYATNTIQNLSTLYLDRLGFSSPEAKALLARGPGKEQLDQILEAHLSHVTFDNLSQHGLPFSACLDVTKSHRKIINEKRGGFCFELNGLFAELLVELGYSVKRVPAKVYTGTEFRPLPTHLLLIVSCANNNNQSWIADVGFGEPSIHSIRYELNTEQETPEGMISRVVPCPEDPNGSVVLEWKKDDSTWAPRLKWDLNHPGQELSQFQEGLDAVLANDSIFHQKLIVCKINRNEKITLAGTRFKRTSPRFGPKSVSTVQELETDDAVKEVLTKHFGVQDTMGLDLTKSRNAQKEIWTQL